jgi:hypothetical protein
VRNYEYEKLAKLIARRIWLERVLKEFVKLEAALCRQRRTEVLTEGEKEALTERIKRIEVVVETIRDEFDIAYDGLSDLVEDPPEEGVA